MRRHLKTALGLAAAAVIGTGAMATVAMAAPARPATAADTTFAGSYAFTYVYYKNGAEVSEGSETIGFGTDGHWTMSLCSDTGTYKYNKATDTVTFTDTTDTAHGKPAYTWIGLPSTGFVGIMRSTAGGTFANERGVSSAGVTSPGSCT